MYIFILPKYLTMRKQIVKNMHDIYMQRAHRINIIVFKYVVY